MKVITIGRHPNNDIVINDPFVGRHHLQIIQHNDGHISLVDLSSTNGTYINNKRVHGEIQLNSSDIVRIGKTILPWKTYFSYSIQPPSCKHPKTLPTILGIIGVIVIIILFAGLLFWENKWFLNNHQKNTKTQAIVVSENIEITDYAVTNKETNRKNAIVTNAVVESPKNNNIKENRYSTYGVLQYRLKYDAVKSKEVLELYNPSSNNIRVKGYLLNTIASRGGENTLDFDVVIAANSKKYVDGFIENRCTITSVKSIKFTQKTGNTFPINLVGTKWEAMFGFEVLRLEFINEKQVIYREKTILKNATWHVSKTYHYNVKGNSLFISPFELEYQYKNGKLYVICNPDGAVNYWTVYSQVNY